MKDIDFNKKFKKTSIIKKNPEKYCHFIADQDCTTFNVRD